MNRTLPECQHAARETVTAILTMGYDDQAMDLIIQMMRIEHRKMMEKRGVDLSTFPFPALAGHPRLHIVE